MNAWQLNNNPETQEREKTQQKQQQITYATSGQDPQKVIVNIL